MNEYLKQEQNFITAVDEFDYREHIKLSALMQYFQDLASLNAEAIGVGFEAMKSQNLYWILSRLSLKIDEYPNYGDTIKVVTYPRQPGLVDSTRDYFITDNRGNKLVSATSKWCVLDMSSHAIKRCSPLFKYDRSKYYPLETYENANLRLDDIFDIDKNPEVSFSSNVRITDLDRNKHMNNARYGDIVLNSCDINFLNSHSVKEFDINFIAELKLGDSFNVFRTTNNDYTYFQGIKNGDNKNIVFRARIKWQSLISK